jgi:hypothetical protein
MSNDAVNKLWECITMIEAQDHLNKLKVTDYDNKMKDKDRNKYHKSIYEKAFPNQEKNIVVTHADLMKALRR